MQWPCSKEWVSKKRIIDALTADNSSPPGHLSTTPSSFASTVQVCTVVSVSMWAWYALWAWTCGLRSNSNCSNKEVTTNWGISSLTTTCTTTKICGRSILQKLLLTTGGRTKQRLLVHLLMKLNPPMTRVEHSLMVPDWMPPNLQILLLTRKAKKCRNWFKKMTKKSLVWTLTPRWSSKRTNNNHSSRRSSKMQSRLCPVSS